jgi:multidrug efflux pump subunit AcrB
MSFGSSSGVSVSVTGRNLSTLKEVAEDIKNTMQGYDGILSATTSLTNGEPRAEIVVDPVQAAAIGMTPSQVLSNVKNVISGITSTSLQEGDNEYSVKVEYPSDRFHDVSDLSGLLLPSSSGGQVPLTDVATVIYTNAPSQIQRSDGKYIVTITAQTSTGVSQTALSNQIMSDLQSSSLPDGVSLSAGESMRMMMTEFGSISEALLISVFWSLSSWPCSLNRWSSPWSSWYPYPLPSPAPSRPFDHRHVHQHDLADRPCHAGGNRGQRRHYSDRLHQHPAPRTRTGGRRCP